MNIYDRAAIFNKNLQDFFRAYTSMQALFIAWYNFGRKHEALKGNTSAMTSGLSDHVWTIKELIERAGRL